MFWSMASVAIVLLITQPVINANDNMSTVTIENMDASAQQKENAQSEEEEPSDPEGQEKLPADEEIYSAIPPPPAAESTATVQAHFPISWNGLVSTAYNISLTQKQNYNYEYLGLRAFDVEQGYVSVDLVELVAQLNPQKAGEGGFKARLGFGRWVPTIMSADQPMAFPVFEGFASYIFPIGTGLRLDAGTFVTHIGLELIEGSAGYNDNYSRSFLFTYGPYAHTGFRLSYVFNEKLNALLSIVNGWVFNQTDINQGKSLGLQVNYKPIDALNIFFNYIGGPEIPFNESSWRHLFNAVLITKPAQNLIFNVDAIYGFELNKGVHPWYGLSLLGTYDVFEKIRLALRVDYFHDEYGVTGFGDTPAVLVNNYYGTKLSSNHIPYKTPAALYGDPTQSSSDVEYDSQYFDASGAASGGQALAVTFTPTLKFGDNFALRCDFRYDKSFNGDLFADPGSKSSLIGIEDDNTKHIMAIKRFQSNQFTIGLNAIAFF